MVRVRFGAVIRESRYGTTAKTVIVPFATGVAAPAPGLGAIRGSRGLCGDRSQRGTAVRAAGGAACMSENAGVDADALAGRFAQMFGALAGNIERVVRGKREKVELALVCLLAEGHLLVEDVPGVGKTTLARAISASVEAEWARIQFTPD